MIRSMTGFARADNESTVGQLVLELRSVNHRYLDISFRLPEELRSFEPLLREGIQKQLGRGKVDCNMRYRAAAQSDGLKVDEAKVKSLLGALEQIGGWMSDAAPLSALDVLQWPGLIEDDKPDQQALRTQVRTLLNQALEMMNHMRAEEGSRMQQLIETRLKQIGDIVTTVRARRQEVIKGVREKLMARIEALDLEADPDRLEQELAFIAQKLDVDEELDRLDSHIAGAYEALAKKEPVGRRLDFLMQEFNREANTLSSKSADAQTTKAAVELKVLIEQMREQVQNIE